MLNSKLPFSIYVIPLLLLLTGCATNPITNVFTKTNLPSAPKPVEASRDFSADFDQVWQWSQVAIQRQGGMVVDSDKHLGFVTYSTATLAKFYVTIYVRTLPSDHRTTVFLRAWFNGVPIYGDLERPFFDALQMISKQEPSRGKS
jgi:hypothetical protein